MKWEKVKLGDICNSIKSGGTPKAGEQSYYDNGDIPWLRTQEVIFNRIYDTEIKITDSGLTNSSAKWIKENSVIIAMYGNSAGRCAINKIPLTTNQACCNLEINSSKADVYFIYYILYLEYERLKGLSKGAAQNNLNSKDIKEFEIFLPLLPLQQKIASILSTYDDLIENNLKRIKLLEEKANLHYNEIINNEVLIKYHLKEVAKINCDTLGKKIGIDNLLYVDISSVGQGVINEKTFYELQDAPGRAKRVVRHQDIIWSCVRPNRRSYALIWNPESNMIVSTGFAVISAKDIPPTFLYQCLTTDNFVSYLENNATGSAYPAVTAKDFEKAIIELPSLEIMLDYDKKAKYIYEMINDLYIQNTKLREARDILLPKLMNGQIEL